MKWDCPLVFLSVQSREALVGGVLIREDMVKQRGAVCFLCFGVFLSSFSSQSSLDSSFCSAASLTK